MDNCNYSFVDTKDTLILLIGTKFGYSDTYSTYLGRI